MTWPAFQMVSASRKSRYCVAIVVSHPIQHFVPFYRALSNHTEIELRVFYCSRIGVEKYFDAGFGMELAWDSDLLSGYEFEFLQGASKIRQTTFFSVNNSDLNQRLDAFQPDAVMVYGYSQLTSLRVIAWCNSHSVPVLMTGDSELKHDRSILKRMLKQVFVRGIYLTVDGFLTIGDNNEAYLRNYGVTASKLFRSPISIDETAFLNMMCSRESRRNLLRQKWDIPDNAFVALFVGKLIERKRPFDLLRAVASLNGSCGRPVIAAFAGVGTLLSAMQAEAKASKIESSRFFGFINQRELPDVYAAADTYVHPAEMDPHPLSINEAAISGLPLIISDRVGSVGPTDTARPGFNAIIYPTGNVATLAEALQKIARNDVLYNDMHIASLAVAKEMSMDAAVAGFVRAIKSVISNR